MMAIDIPIIARQYTVPTASYRHYRLRLEDAPVPTPKANEVLVKIKAVSLQSRDLMVLNNEYPPPIAADVVPCSDMAGEVVAVGADVARWTPGDRVMANFFLELLFEDSMTTEIKTSALGGAVHGVLTEYRAFPEHSLVAIPSHLNYEEASTLPCAALTAYNALVYGFQRVKAGDTVLIQGTGGVSIFALQFSLASGALPIVLSASDEKLRTATNLGAKHGINYLTTPAWDEAVRALTGGRGVDHVLEVVGNATLERSLKAVRIGGSVNIIGMLGGKGVQGDAPPPHIIGTTVWNSIKIRGVYVGSVAQFEDMNRLLAANPDVTRPVIDKVFSFEEAREGFAYLQSQKHVGKVVIRVA
ncbi:Alcohol dehydrogenase superfamily protein [Mycena indigotica]|uniref:Alcohol dehydrogenase superfamily protein n=1 Tax=Mycena indigotica TaxID=2126181 RepID=A0A8H6W912_9AGAR|nr:Alcohol dehydrogenase superfamily protein [Mycena indigotica]KAF7309242.1 Alcohol dehydrogenase superfamily protein [Mycena indigotica]